MKLLSYVMSAAGFCALMSGAASAQEPKVVVTLKPIHALVSEVMAGVGTPALIVDGAASPHTFSLKPSQALAISNADVFIRVSEQVEPFTRKIVSALPKSVRVVSLVDSPGMTVLDQRRGATFDKHSHHDDAHAHHDDDHDHDGAAKDGHIWLDTNNAAAIVDAVAAALSASYPDSASKLNSNATALKAKISGLASEIETELAPVKGRPFIVFHDAIQYFENRFKVPATGSITISPDVQPSAKRLTAVRKKIEALGAVCIFSEPGFQPKLVAAVTDGTSARAGTLDPEGATLQPGPELYFVLMRSMAQNIKTCLSAG